MRRNRSITRSPRPTAQAGFSLIEIIIVTVLIGGIVAFAASKILGGGSPGGILPLAHPHQIRGMLDCGPAHPVLVAVWGHRLKGDWHAVTVACANQRHRTMLHAPTPWANARQSSVRYHVG